MNGVRILTAFVFCCCSVAAQYEGENCTIPVTNENGRCIKIHDCMYAINLLKQKKNPKTCGFVGNDPLVCCPTEIQNSSPGKLSDEKCDKYFNIENQVYAIDLGTKALAKEFPHMAAVGYGESNSEILWLCGGTLISHRFVLSAAHCADSAEFGPALWVRLGDLDLKNTTEDANPQDVRIQERYVHPDYKRSSHYHDIALFKMEKETSFVVYFKPACLQTTKNLPVTNNLEATGWGKIGFLGESSSHLMKVSLDIIEHKVCARRYKNLSTRKLQNGILDNLQICAGNFAGGDTCPGDSGGPLHYRVDRDEKLVSHFVVAGITSFGRGCGGGSNSAGVYTRVSAYVAWIENIVWKEDQ